MTERLQSKRLQLVGDQHIIADGVSEELVSFYGDLFGRLRTEVKNTSDLTRYVGFQSPAGKDGHLHFFGIEVNGIEDIPEGMIAWDLDENTRTVWRTQDGQDEIISQEDIVWQWLDRATASLGRWTGEFSTRSSAPFWLSANAYVDLRVSSASNDDVELVDYDPSWPQQFAEFATWLYDLIGADVALRIEHYGSTAIPGIPAKPIIDVLVEVPTFAEAKRTAIPRLNSEKWEYWWYSDHMTFIKREKLMGRRTHHVHMAPRGHRLWEGLAFRDYLVSHPQEMSRYAALKRKLANSYRQDRERYTQAKTEFVREITSKALCSRIGTLACSTSF